MDEYLLQTERVEYDKTDNERRRDREKEKERTFQFQVT